MAPMYFPTFTIWNKYLFYRLTFDRLLIEEKIDDLGVLLRFKPPWLWYYLQESCLYRLNACIQRKTEKHLSGFNVIISYLSFW